MLPLLITDPHRLFQPATFLKGSSQLRSSIRAFLAGTKFSRLASFSCPEEAYFKKLVFVEKFKTYTEVEFYSRIPFYLSCSFSGYHICQQTRCKGPGQGWEGPGPRGHSSRGRGLRPAPTSPTCSGHTENSEFVSFTVHGLHCVSSPPTPCNSLIAK